MSDEVQWVEILPLEVPRRVERVIAQLQTRPYHWALVAKFTGFPPILAWWNSLYKDPAIETSTVRGDTDRSYGECEIYARFIGEANPNA